MGDVILESTNERRYEIYSQEDYSPCKILETGNPENFMWETCLLLYILMTLL